MVFQRGGSGLGFKMWKGSGGKILRRNPIFRSAPTELPAFSGKGQKYFFRFSK
jgi:hypothetical protein